MVVLVPGLGLDARSWTAVRARLRGPSLVIRLPSLGHRARSGTDLHVGQLSRRLLAALPPAVEVVLVGHSASCPVVVDAALYSPAVVGLVLLGPVTDPRARSWPRLLTQWVGTAVHEHVWEVPILAPQYRSTGATSMARGMTRIRRYRTDVGLSKLSVPSVIIRGQRDQIASKQWSTQLARSPLVQLVSVPRAAHMLPLTHPGVVADSIERLQVATTSTPAPHPGCRPASTARHGFRRRSSALGQLLVATERPGHGPPQLREVVDVGVGVDRDRERTGVEIGPH